MRALTLIIPRNENASTVYTTDVLNKMFKEEGGSLFDSRAAALGHTLQGGVPSPMDRARAVRLSLKCMAFIEQEHDALNRLPAKERVTHMTSSSVITIQGTSIEWVPVQEMVAHVDMQNRRGKTAWWMGLKELVEVLAGRPQFIGPDK